MEVAGVGQMLEAVQAEGTLGGDLRLVAVGVIIRERRKMIATVTTTDRTLYLQVEACLADMGLAAGDEHLAVVVAEEDVLLEAVACSVVPIVIVDWHHSSLTSWLTQMQW